MRTCKTCKQTKEETEFPISDRQMGYRRRECHACYKARHRAYYEERGSTYRARVKGSYEVKRARVYSAYGDKCACCGETNQKFLSIDHVNQDGYDLRPFHGKGRQLFTHIEREGYPDSFQLLCFNCNLGRARNGGVCPHKEGSTTIPKGSTGKRPEVPSPSC